MDIAEVGNYVASSVPCVNDVTVKRDGADCNGFQEYFKIIYMLRIIWKAVIL